MKRFWTDVAVEADGGIKLDARPVRTPGRTPLILPTAALAEAVAAEWRAVEGDIDPRAMPLTGLANAAIDRIGPDPARFADDLARYAASDLLCYRAEAPTELVARQALAWDPPLDWARTRYDVHFAITRGIMHVDQPTATVTRLSDAVRALGAFDLAALSPVVTITGSLVLALALIEQAMPSDAIWATAHVDEDWQTERWGEDALAARSLAAKRAEYDGAVRFLAALRV
ncbi:ATP12 family chaperone protein [uncultured Sphingomonas sp.]|uniref:ATP12 family chaperone protein n=1 Tax=uncultured Sphingomonas sp. TaxID=158754 RepID=UPI0035CB064A